VFFQWKILNLFFFNLHRFVAYHYYLLEYRVKLF
jgi:hypothetical protein